MVGLSSQALTALLSGALAVSVGGGVVCVADHAAPGDLLYGIDVGVGEPLRAAGALSSQSKITAEVRTAGERLAEAGDLALQGDLDLDTADELSIKFQKAANQAQQKIAVLADSDADLAADLAAEQERLLSAQADLLGSLGLLAEADARAALGRLEVAARAEADAAKKLRIAVDRKAGGPGLEAHARVALDVATKAVVEAQADAAAAKSGLAAGVNADLTAQLNAANRALLNGQAQLEAGAFVEAADMLTTATRLADQASLFADVMVDLEATGKLNADSVLNAVKTKGQSNLQVEVDADLEADAGGSVSGGQRTPEDNGDQLDHDGLLPDTGIEIDLDGNVVEVDDLLNL